jgi:hypothetical protein
MVPTIRKQCRRPLSERRARAHEAALLGRSIRSRIRPVVDLRVVVHLPNHCNAIQCSLKISASASEINGINRNRKRWYEIDKRTKNKKAMFIVGEGMHMKLVDGTSAELVVVESERNPYENPEGKK